MFRCTLCSLRSAVPLMSSELHLGNVFHHCVLSSLNNVLSFKAPNEPRENKSAQIKQVLFAQTTVCGSEEVRGLQQSISPSSGSNPYYFTH